MGRFVPKLSTFEIALAFAAVAALCRALLRHTETRSQILAFAVVLVLFELFGRRHFGAPRSLRGFLLNLLMVVLAMVCVKLMIEGPPHYGYWFRKLSRAFF